MYRANQDGEWEMYVPSPSSAQQNPDEMDLVIRGTCGSRSYPILSPPNSLFHASPVVVTLLTGYFFASFTIELRGHKHRRGLWPFRRFRWRQDGSPFHQPRPGSRMTPIPLPGLWVPSAGPIFTTLDANVGPSIASATPSSWEHSASIPQEYPPHPYYGHSDNSAKGW